MNIEKSIKDKIEERKTNIIKGFVYNSARNLSNSPDYVISDDLEKARNVGETKVGKDGITRVWTQLPSGKFDWRRKAGNPKNEKDKKSEDAPETNKESIDPEVGKIYVLNNGARVKIKKVEEDGVWYDNLSNGTSAGLNKEKWVEREPKIETNNNDNPFLKDKPKQNANKKQKDFTNYLNSTVNSEDFLKYANKEINAHMPLDSDEEDYTEQFSDTDFINGLCDIFATYVYHKFDGEGVEVFSSGMPLHHTFIKYQDKYYDGLNKEGVDNFLDLEFFVDNPNKSKFKLDPYDWDMAPHDPPE